MPSSPCDSAEFTLCDIPGPWLHQSTPQLCRMDDGARERLGNSLNSRFSALTSGQGLTFINAVVDHARTSIANLEPMDRTTVAIRCNVSEQHHQRKPTTNTINNSVRTVLKHGLIPLVVLDIFLHFSDPGNEAAAVEQNEHRPSTSTLDYVTHFALHQDLFAILREASASVKKAAKHQYRAPKSVGLIKDDKKRAVLSRCSYLNGSGSPGRRQAYNHVQAAFLLTAFLGGYCTLKKADIATVSFNNARRVVPGISKQDIEGAITNPDPAGLFASIAVAVLHGGYFLTREVKYAHKNFNPGHSFFEEWVAKGNKHRLDRDSMPAKLDLAWWELLIDTVGGSIDPQDVPQRFFENEQVKTLAFPPEVPSVFPLGFASDHTITQPLITFNDNDVIWEYIDSDVDESRVEESPLPTTSLKPKKKKEKTSSNDRLAAPEPGVGHKYATRMQDGTMPRPKTDVTMPRSTMDIKRPERHKKPATSVRPKNQQKQRIVEWPSIELFAVHSSVTPTTPEQVFLSERVKTHPLDFSMPRPTVEESETLLLPFESPTAIFGDSVKYEFKFTPFKNFESDLTMLPDIINAQPRNSEGVPLFLLPSARDPDPTLRPSDQQSVFFIATTKEFYQLSPRVRYLIWRYRAIILLEDDFEPPPPFNESTLSRFRDPSQLCQIQDMGLEYPHDKGGDDDDDDRDNEYYLRVGKLSDLLPHDGRPTLNAINHPLPNQSVPSPPCLDSFTSIETVMAHLRGHPHLPAAQIPWEVFRWALVSTRGARSPTHGDITATVIRMLLGLKTISIAVPRSDRFENNNNEGNWLSRHSIDNWDDSQESARTDVFRWETFVLRPGMTFFMPHGMRHFITSPEDSVAYGVHTIHSAQAPVAIGVVLTLTMCDSCSANEPVEPVRWLFPRMFIFWAEKIMNGASVSLNHFPDVLSREGLFEILYLAAYVILYGALRPEAYVGVIVHPIDAHGSLPDLGVPLPMHEQCYADYEYALLMVVRLVAYLDNNFDLRMWDPLTEIAVASPTVISAPRYNGVQALLEHSVINMACCVVSQREEWLKDRKIVDANDFTTLALEQQIRRSLASYEWMRIHATFDTSDTSVQRELPLFKIGLEERRLSTAFDMRRTSNQPFSFYLPWDLTAAPTDERYFGVILCVTAKKRSRQDGKGEEENGYENAARVPKKAKH